MSILSGTDDFPLEDKYHCSPERWYDSEFSHFLRLQPGYIRLGDAHNKLHLVAENLMQEIRCKAPSHERLITQFGRNCFA